MRVRNYGVGAVEHSHLLSDNNWKLETDYGKISKLIDHMLGSDLAPHILGMVSAGLQHKLLFIAYSCRYISLLHMMSFSMAAEYTQTTMEILKKILMEMWNIQVGASTIESWSDCLYPFAITNPYVTDILVRKPVREKISPLVEIGLSRHFFAMLVETNAEVFDESE